MLARIIRCDPLRTVLRRLEPAATIAGKTGAEYGLGVLLAAFRTKVVDSISKVDYDLLLCLQLAVVIIYHLLLFVNSRLQL